MERAREFQLQYAKFSTVSLLIHYKALVKNGEMKVERKISLLLRTGSQLETAGFFPRRETTLCQDCS